ncbi:MAG: hypothetical protein GKR89_34580 [Candidatus Latescibacteria bacterium]|nr:hypothetical protein [Candidatus Latescibacterota bacterium]
MLRFLILLCCTATSLSATQDQAAVDDMHTQALSSPSASQCRTCHPSHYDQWSVSPHSYAQLSPVYNAMHGTILKLTNGTSGDFCIRCHSTFAMSLGEEPFMANSQRSPISREGITCITCHRVNRDFGKFSGRFTIEHGGLTLPIYGTSDGTELERAMADPDYNLSPDPEKVRGRPVHLQAQPFFQLPEPGFCGVCHDVNFVNGFRLEEAFSEYKSAPAASDGITCQDCHMGTEPGVYSGDPKTNYRRGPAAVVSGKATPARKLTDHTFAGPDHSIVHPGFFPHNPEAAEFATLDEWLEFDYRAGWGTPDFEESVEDDEDSFHFPPRWSDPFDREEARFLIEGQLEKLNAYMEQRHKVLRQGYQIGRIETRQASTDGLEFSIEVRNGTDGHNVPTGFIAERVLFLQVIVVDAVGDTLFQSGDLDPNGDIRDSHSLYVHDGRLPQDPFLFSLQSSFITRNTRGSEREQVVAVNFSADPLPFSRPSTFSPVLTGRAAGARIHRKSIEPLGNRWARYQIGKDQLSGQPPYRAQVRLIAGMVPINLVQLIQLAGFDYNMSGRQVADAVVKRHDTLWEYQALIHPALDPGLVRWQAVEVAAPLWDQP